LLLAALVLGAGCSGDDDDESGGSDSTASAAGDTTTTEQLTPEEEVAAAYMDYWREYDELVENPAPTIDSLTTHASGQALDSATQAVADLESQGLATEFGPLERHNPYAPSVIDAQTAYVADCHVSDARVVDAEGQVVRGDPPEGRPESIAADLIRDGDTWVVDSLTYYDLAPGETCTSAGPGPAPSTPT
jgi:hypothetical protein